jgi:hypothetical protein
MRAFALAILALAPSCKSVECGPGTFEENGVCVPADNTVNAAACGPFTELIGGQCVPQFPPTVCDDTSTLEELDVATGVTTCIGSGVGFACPQPATGKQTICGQLFDLETGAPFSDPGAQCTPCGAPTATGVCSLHLRALDAVKFGTNPMDPTAVLATGPVYLDDCGRYRIPDIDVPTNPFVGIGIDDAAMPMQGPPGTTNAIGLATPAVPNVAVKDFEAFVAPASTTTKWSDSGGPPISGGMFVAIFRANRTGTANQAGVTILREGAPIPGDDFYFAAGETTRETIDNAVNATGANGTALVTDAALDGYIGAGGLPPECRYEGHAGVALPFVLFVQIFRPTDAAGQTCNR